MTAMQIIFLIVAAVTLGGALMIATSRRMMHTVLWLVLTLMGVAVLFALLQANFFSVVQVLVYIGAIAILILFGVMLTRRSMVDAGDSLVRKNWWVVAVVIALLFAAIVISIQPWGAAHTPLVELMEFKEPISDLGEALVDPAAYLIPFEVSSVLLLAVMVAAIYIAVDRKGGKS